LRGEVHNRRIQGLRNSKPHEWWREMKKVTGQSTKSELMSLVNSVANGDTQLLASMISGSLQQVTNNLSPTSPKQVSKIGSVADKQTFEHQSSQIARAGWRPDLDLTGISFAAVDPIRHVFNASVSTGRMPDL
jgi:hypothetical protein